eukprot:UN12538
MLTIRGVSITYLGSQIFIIALCGKFHKPNSCILLSAANRNFTTYFLNPDRLFFILVQMVIDPFYWTR